MLNNFQTLLTFSFAIKELIKLITNLIRELEDESTKASSLASIIGRLRIIMVTPLLVFVK